MDNYVIEKVVTEDMLAVNVGSGGLRVLATPAVAALMEEASYKLAETICPDGITTVGTALDLCHTSPTPLGAVVRVESTLTEKTDRTMTFAVVAWDNAGEIARATHTRVTVKGEKFQIKANSKLD